MNRFSFHALAVILAAVFAVFVTAFFVGCDSGDDGTPSQSPPDVAGTYYAIANFGGGDKSIMLVLQMPSNDPTNDGYYVLTGFVSYGDSVLLKPNFIAPKSRRHAVQTDPELILQTAKLLNYLNRKS